jgi:glyoxalase family protein
LAARVNGLHHVTSGVWGAQEDIDFFTEVVGQRMIKQTILFDGTVSFYHLYYANADAEIGSVSTTFPFSKMGIKVAPVPARSARPVIPFQPARCPSGAAT